MLQWLKTEIGPKARNNINDPIKHMKLTFPKTKLSASSDIYAHPSSVNPVLYHVIANQIKFDLHIKGKKHNKKSCLWKGSWPRLDLVSGVRLSKSLHVGIDFLGNISSFP